MISASHLPGKLVGVLVGAERRARSGTRRCRRRRGTARRGRGSRPGAEIAISAMPIDRRSSQEPVLTAESMPIGMPIDSHRIDRARGQQDRRPAGARRSRAAPRVVLVRVAEVEVDDRRRPSERRRSADVVEELLVQRLVEAELLADRRDELRRRLAAGAQHRRVGGRQHGEDDERDQRDHEQQDDHPDQSADDVGGHGGCVSVR